MGQLDIITNIFIGVFAGIITSLLIWIIIVIIRRLVIPWYQQFVYRGIDLSGEWKSKHEYGRGTKVDQMIGIEQKGHKISGTIISYNCVDKKEYTSHYTITGEIFDNYVDLEYKIKDKKFIGRGSMLLKVIEGGEKLKGGLIAVERYNHTIVTFNDIVWERNN
jgi:hypothetical protein